ncbi:MAG: hypothetical protein WA988_15865, partial [Candidatus Nanopelagicales bacterium]
PEGYTKEDADKAEIAEAKELQQRSAQRSGASTLAAPTDCMTYWPEWRYQVCGAIRVKYDSLGGPNSFLLWPTSNELVNPDGIGRRSTFNNGPIYWSPSGGAHPVVNHFFAAWQRNGWESGKLGYPTSDEIVNGDGVGRRQLFQGGTVYWKLNEAYYVTGAIRDRWGQLGSEAGWLGYPLSDETRLPDGTGYMNRFEHGVIYWHPSYGARPVGGGLLDKWTLSGYERGPYGYPVSDQRPRGSSFDQDFEFGTMGWPTDPVAAVGPGDEDIDVTVNGAPNSWSERAADAAVGLDTTTPPVALNQGLTLAACGQESCLTDNPGGASDPEDPNPSGPNTQTTFIPPWCETQSHDGVFRSYRKNSCMVRETGLAVHDARTGAQIGTYPLRITSGIITSHRDGVMEQEFRFGFGIPTGDVGAPKMEYRPRYSGYGSSAFNVSLASPPTGFGIAPSRTYVVVVTWKQQSMSDNAVENRVTNLDFWFANSDPNITQSTTATVVMSSARCDSTIKNSQGGWQQGCVFPAYTPGFVLSNSSHPIPVPEVAGHIARAQDSGLPGSRTRPLHRQADNTTRDINRQTACPRTGPKADGRRTNGRTCDEYPFASTTEGAASGGPGRSFNPNCHVNDFPAPVTAPTGYSVCMIDAAQNKRGGTYLGTFYGSQRVINQDAFYVQVSGGSLPPAP